MSSQISLRTKLFLILFGVSISLLILEIGLHIIARSKRGTEFASLDELRHEMSTAGNEESTSGGVNLKALIFPHEDDAIIYDLRPHLDVAFQRARVVTNSCGMRGPERPIAKPAHTYRIALLGDSFAFGWGVEQKETFAQRLEDNLNHHFQGRPKIEVLNFGVPGYSTFQEVHQFLDKGAAFNPDAIVVFFIQNDFGPPFFIRNFGNQGIVASSFVAQLALKALDQNSEEHELLRTGFDPNRSLNQLADYTSEHGIKLFLAINPKKDWKQILNQLFVTRARKEIEVMNLRKDFVRIIKQKNYQAKDLSLTSDPHPNALRHSIYGDIMTPYLMSAISK